MQKDNTVYVTTPIFYANDIPHIGTSYTVFLADTIARYFRQKLGRENVLFITGTDEHGSKVAKTAESLGKSPQEFVDEISNLFKDIWLRAGVDFDYFMRTTHPEHKNYTQWLIQKVFENGDIYVGTYEGLYCEGCEAYYKESDLVNGRCPNHPTKELVITSEKNYYFALSKYTEKIKHHIENNPKFIQPEKWKDYVMSLLDGGIEDIPVTRANVSWGIPVPFDPKQTIYVWFDALPNYISYLNFKENKKKNYEKVFWHNAIHVIGKDIIKFHTILWPAMLMSAGLELPRTILVHGFFTVNGVKIGKSNGNVINPVELINKFGVDALRYALLTEFQIGNDGDFSLERLKAKYTTELSNNFGNLLSRVIHLSNKKNIQINNFESVQEEFKIKILSFIKQFQNLMEDYKIKEANDILQELFAFGNKYIDTHKIWLSNDSRLDKLVLNNLSFLLYQGIISYLSIIPEAASKALEALMEQKPIILFKKL